MNNRESKDEVASAWPRASTLLAALPTAITVAAGYVWVSLAGWIAPEGQSWSFPAKLVLQVAGLLGLVLLYLGGLYLYLWRRNRKRIRFGILWDRDGNPMCSKCEAPLNKNSGTSLKCGPCDITYSLYQLETGGSVTVWDAYKAMRPKASRIRDERAARESGAPVETTRSIGERPEMQTIILRCLIGTELSIEDICARVRISSELAKFHLDALFEDGFLDIGQPMTGYPYSLRQKARAYLNERSLLK